MHRIIFYSWQSDLPNATNRSFIQRALENVAKSIKIDDTIDVEPVIDRDTQGVPGAPDIAKTIFQKIVSADIVVADVSIIGGRQKGRHTPNPNVLIELGYALHALGDERVLLVFNTAYGKLEQLPFDLKMRRAIPYHMPDSPGDRATERRALEAKLDMAIRAALASIKTEPTRSLTSEAIQAVEGAARNRVVVARRFIAEVLMRLKTKRPKSIAEGTSLEDIEQAVLRVEDIAFDFGRLAYVVAAVGDDEVAWELYRGFGSILEEYEISPGFGGMFYEADFDFIKFHGYELFTMFIACLIRERRWQLIAGILGEGIPVRHKRGEDGPSNCFFYDVSEHLEFDLQLSRTRGVVSVRAIILKTRHNTDRPLGELVSFDDFMAADYFLFLRGELAPDSAPTGFIAWRPWSVAFLRAAPRFIRDAESVAVALSVAKALSVPDITILRERLADRAVRLKQLFRSPFSRQPLRQEDIDKIGTHGS